MRENGNVLCALASLEDLAEKKTKIYARLLTETSIATEMERLSSRHATRKSALTALYEQTDTEETNDEA